MSKPRKKKRGKKAVLRRDEFAVKPQPAPPAIPNEPPAPPKGSGVGRGQPKTLDELWQRVKRSVYAVIADLFGLPADVTNGARQIIQQIPEYAPELVKSVLVTPRISEAIAKRIERADKQEAAAQAASASGTNVALADALDRLQAILAKLQAKGTHVESVDVSGLMSILAVRPELADAARAIAAAGITEQTSVAPLPAVTDAEGV